MTKKIRALYDSHPRCPTVIPPEEKRTKDSFKDECDINRVMERYKKTGLLPQLQARGLPRYEDVSDVPSYQEALNIVSNAEHAFYQLPASVRAACDNNPAVFLDRVNDRRFLEEHQLVPTPSPDSSGAPAPLSAPGQGANAGTEPASSPKGKKSSDA